MINTNFKYNLNNSAKISIEDHKSNPVMELNGFFISHFFKLMYNTVDVLASNDPAFGDSSGEKIFREFLLNEYGKVMSTKFQLTNEMMDRYMQNIKLEKTIDVTT